MLLEAAAFLNSQLPDDYCLSEIPDFQSLLQKANNVGVPVFAVSDQEIENTGTVLIQMQEKREFFDKIFTNLSNQIIHIKEYVEG